jgi:succinyl-CoA synthetase beta subunit
MHKNIAAYAPGLALDGLLVEAMAGKGVELMIGARRDPAWGAVLLIGLGGIWVEALGDVRLLPADASEDWIRAEIMKLKTSKLLTGFRGAPAADIEAVVKTARALGRLMQTRTEIAEIDINPLVVHAKGQGATALDALIVTNG